MLSKELSANWLAAMACAAAVIAALPRLNSKTCSLRQPATSNDGCEPSVSHSPAPHTLGEPAPLEPGIGAAFLPIVSFVTRTLQRLPSNTDYPRFFSGTYWPICDPLKLALSRVPAATPMEFQ